MRKTFLVCLSLLMLTGAAAAFGQDSGMLQVYTVHVQMGQQQHYASVLPGLWDAFEKAGVAVPVFVSSGVSEPETFNLVSPLASFAQLDSSQGTVSKAVAAAPDVVAELQGMTTSTDRSIWLVRPELGYTPQPPRLQPGEATFSRGLFLYPYPDKVQAFTALIKEGADLRKKHGIGDGVGVAQMVIGEDGPTFLVIVDARDEADFYVQQAKAVEKMGAEWQAFLAKTGPMLRRVEMRSWRNRLDLSYQP